MPNTIPSIRTGDDSLIYIKSINGASGSTQMHSIPCIKAVAEFTTPETIHDAWGKGVRAIKIYFEGVTTNASAGDAISWEDLWEMEAVWEACAEIGMVICVHPEKPGAFVMEREYEAHPAITFLADVAGRHPGGKLTVEHVIDRRTIDLIMELPEHVRCTVTAHHLAITLDAVIGGNLDVHAFCKPVAKTPVDLTALIDAAKGDNPKIMFGSDSAPHPMPAKVDDGCAGCFTAPFCLQLVAHVFEKAEVSALKPSMQAFMGDRAREFYGAPKFGRRVKLVKEPFKIPPVMKTVDGTEIVPFWAGRTLNWSLEIM